MKTKLLFFALLFCMSFFGFSQTILRFENDITNTPSYTFTSTDVYYRDMIGTNISSSTTSTCAGAPRRTQTANSISYLEVKSSSVSQLVIQLTSNGTGTRTLISIETAASLTGTYTALTGFTNVSTLATGPVTSTTCGTITLGNLTIPQNTFLRLTFNGNSNISGFDITSAAPVLQPTTQASAITFNAITSSSFTTSWTNGNGSSRVVFVKEGTQGTITNPTDGVTYSADSNFNNGTPAGTQLGTSGYYCVYNGTASTVNITNLNSNSNYWVQVFEYNGLASTSDYLTTTTTGNPANTSTIVGTAPLAFRSVTSGDWATNSTWETSTDNVNYIPAIVAPDANNSTQIVVRNTHTVTISSGTISADQTQVEATGIIAVATGATFDINDGTSTDLILDGNLELSGSLTSNAGATIVVNGILENKTNSATFSPGLGSVSVSAGGTYKINGYTGTSAYAFSNMTFTAGIGAAGANYYVASGAPRITSSMNLANVIWDSPSAGGSFLNNPSASISGNFTLLSSVGINHGAGGSGRTLTVAGDFIIQNGKYEISGTGATINNNLNVLGNVIQNGGTFNLSSSTIAGGIGTLNATKNVTLNAGFFGLASGSSNGNVVLNGTTSQTITIQSTMITLVQNLTIANPSTVLFAGNANFNVQGDVSFGNVNNATLNAGGNLALVSNANFTGRLADITNSASNSGNVVLGNVKVEHFIPLGKRAFRFVTPSVTTANFIANNWQLQTHITGSATGANGFDATTTGNPSLYTYANQVATGTGWTPIASTNATNLTAGLGYRLLVRGDRNVNLAATSQDVMNNPITLSATGSLVTGTVTYNATSSPAINNTTNTTTADYSLVGNPYASSVDWHLISKTDLLDSYYGWDANLGTSSERGRYVVYSQTTETTSVQNGTGTTNIGRYIQSGQSFFVKNTTSGIAGSLVFNESNKATNQFSVFKNASNNTSKIFVNLYDSAELNQSGFPIDGAVSVIGTNFSTDLGLGDVSKLEAAGQNLMFLRNNTKLAIENIGEPTITDELQVYASNLEANTSYSFKVGLENYTSSNNPFWFDTLTGSVTPIANNQIFNLVTTSNPTTFAADRFKIVFTSSPLGNNSFDLTTSVYPNPSSKNGINLKLNSNSISTKNIQVYNSLGQKMAVEVSNLSDATFFIKPSSSVSSGLYFINITSENGVKSIKWIIE